MPKNKNLGENLRVRLTFQQSEQIKKQIGSGLYSSESDFVRQAINAFLKKTDPPYTRPSLKDQEKLDRIKAEEEQSKMGDEEYIHRYLKDVYVLTDDDGKKFMIYRMQGRSFGAMPIDQVKEWVKARDWNFEYSQKALKEDPSLEPWEELLMFAGPRQVLATYFEVNIKAENVEKVWTNQKS